MHRYRVREYYAYAPGVTTSSSQSNAFDAMDLTEDIRVRSSDPDWRSKVASGKDASMPYTRTVVRSKFEIGEVTSDLHSVSPYLRATQYGLEASLPNLESVPYDIDDVHDMVYLTYMGKIREQITAFSTPTFIGELRETVKMLKNPVLGLRKGVDDLINKLNDQKRRRFSSKDLADLWLEYSFGWAPLIVSVSDGMSALADLHLQPRLEKVSTTLKLPYESSHNVPDALGYVNYKTIGAIQGTYSVRYSGVLKRRQESSFSANMDLFGLNWQELAPTAWELFPWSFLLDYFTTIGEAIEANVLLSQVEKVYLNRTIQHRSRFDVEVVPTSPQAQSGSRKILSYKPQREATERMHFQRTPIELRVVVPTTRVFTGFSWKRYLNLTALARGRFN